MPRPDWRAVSVLACLSLLAACRDTRDLAPQSPDQAWQPVASSGLHMPPGATGFASPVGAAAGQPVPVEPPGTPLGLVELIDLAARHNPQTRIAWDQAREAAIAVGISGAGLLPQITVSALGGFQRQAFPLPTYLSRRGYLTSNARALFPKLEISYLLFDFGQTADRVREANSESLAANYGFTEAHQALILAVTRAYYAYDAATNALGAAQGRVQNTQLLLKAAQSLQTHGEGTLPNVAIARRNLEQARFALTRVEGAQHAARFMLLDAMGMEPTTQLTIRPTQDAPISTRAPADIKALLDRALASRPDVLADLARTHAADAAVEAARASLAPRIGIAADVQGYLGSMKSYGTYQEAPASSIAQPEAGAFLQLTWPLYEGGARANTIHLAEVRADQARTTLNKTMLAAERDVAMAQDALVTATAQNRAAHSVTDAARVAFQAASQSYAHGVGTLTDASSAADALATAQAEQAASHAQVLTDAAALAFATGKLTSTAETDTE